MSDQVMFNSEELDDLLSDLNDVVAAPAEVKVEEPIHLELTSDPRYAFVHTLVDALKTSSVPELVGLVAALEEVLHEEHEPTAKIEILVQRIMFFLEVSTEGFKSLVKQNVFLSENFFPHFEIRGRGETKSAIDKGIIVAYSNCDRDETGKKIEAIKYVREAVGLSLIDAKYYVEKIIKENLS